MEAFRDEKTFGPYQLHAKIAEGGMAEVVLGTSQQKEYQGQFLAIKRLRPHLNSNKPFVNLLIHEAKIGVLLNHPGIATVYDLGSYKSEFFLTMEYVHGKSLDKILDRIRETKSPRLSVEVATFVILEILRALAFAHSLKDSKGRELNIIHRDISPGNILLSYRGEAKLTDFGIATAESRLQPNFSNVPLGKLAYMSPEQVVNDPVVRASDIYSLGVVFYQLLSGQLPFHADNANALYKKVIDGRITDLRLTGPTISPGLRDIVNKCLNRSPAKRYQSAPELYQVLVDHFVGEYELDFNSKTIRQYYKKKLSEYMRAAFEADIIQEIEITQDCLKRGVKNENFNVTTPQDLKRLADFEKEGPEPEATVHQEDLTNESTRHFPLTEEERQRIIKGLPAKEVLTATRKRMEAKSGRTSNFDLQTIPEYDLATEDSSLQRISIQDKLKLSSLDKDQKETLKQQAPDMEISSEQDLQKFEQNTLSDKRAGVDVNSTRAMSRDEIIRDFKQIENMRSGAKSKKSVLDEETVYDPNADPKKNKFSEANPSRVSLGNIKNFKPVERTSIVEVKEPVSFRPKWAVIALGILVLGGVAAWLTTSRQSFKFSSPSVGLLTPQTITLAITGELPTEAQKKFIDGLKEGPESISGIETLFANEYKKYRGAENDIIHLKIGEPRGLSSPVTNESNATDLVRSDSIFDFLNKDAGGSVLNESAVIYIYLFSFDPSSNQNITLPNYFVGKRNRQRGIVFAPAHHSKRLFVLENIAREVAFLFGAKNKEDLGTGLAIAPQGLANPKEIPLYPQSKAELTGRDIALNSLQERPITSLQEIVIGPQTAFELGWIDSATRDKFLK